MRQRDLVINALRMRPDRIVLGEVRGEEALDMLQAMNTGHEGPITTVHAHNPRHTISRRHTMCVMGTHQLQEQAIPNRIAPADPVLIQPHTISDGSSSTTSQAGGGETGGAARASAPTTPSESSGGRRSTCQCRWSTGAASSCF